MTYRARVWLLIVAGLAAFWLSLGAVVVMAGVMALVVVLSVVAFGLVFGALWPAAAHRDARARNPRSRS